MASIIVQLDKKHARLNGDPPNQEHCTLDAATWARFGNQPQLLIRRDANRLALFTVIEKYDAGGAVARVGTPGLERLGGAVKAGCLGSIFSASFAEFGAAVEPNFLSNLDEETAKRGTALIEQSVGSGTAIAVLAPHGGMIEEHTDTQARRVYELLAAAGKSARLWMCRGWKKGGGASECWHITSTELSPRSFPKLAAMFTVGFTQAVAFHGWKQAHIGVGGLASEDFRKRIVAAIQGVVTGVTVKLEDKTYAGSSPVNIVNSMSGGNGVQIEQPAAVRDTAANAEAIATAVAEVYLSG